MKESSYQHNTKKNPVKSSGIAENMLLLAYRMGLLVCIALSVIVVGKELSVT